MAEFRDHFSGHAADYARHRPRYPAALYDWLADAAPTRGRAWDCATGNGQAAVALAGRFEAVEATDASAEQVAAGAPHPRVRYRVAPAHDSGLDAGSVDLVTVAQALHWFDAEPFWAEVRRVLRPGGLVAVWCYELFQITPAVDAAVDRLYTDIVGEDWPPQRRHIESGYTTLPFPWQPLPPDQAPPAFEMRADWGLAEVVGYLRTWSAVRRYEARTGHEPVALVVDELAAAWGGEGARRDVRWPLRLRVGRQRSGSP